MNDIDCVPDLQARKCFKAVILIYSYSTTNAISKYIYGDIKEEKGSYKSFKCSFWSYNTKNPFSVSKLLPGT